ncbi:transcription-repair coupling factor [Vibrio owensii]|uniref:transcription-repair coupling factor n=1 Tax=Vibrio owensii TaxID=696485 RepID=UPI003CC68E2B
MIDKFFTTELPNYTSKSYGGVSGSSVASIITGEFKVNQKTSVLVCSTDQQAQETYNQIRFFNKDIDSSNILYLPGVETLPYDLESPHSELISERARVFFEVYSALSDHKAGKNTQPKLIVTSITTLIQKVCGQEHWVDSAVVINRNDTVDIKNIISHLENLGYQQNTLEATSMYTYFVANQNVDIFTSGESAPIRIKTSNGKITSMKMVDIDTQITIGEELNEVILLPAREIPVSAKGVRTFKINYRQTFNRAIGDSLYETVSRQQFPSGIESLLPLFTSSSESILQSLKPLKPSIYMLEGTRESVQKYMIQVVKRYEELSGDKTRPMLQPNKIWLDGEDLSQILAELDTFTVSAAKSKSNTKVFNTELTNISRKTDLQEILDMLEPITDDAEKTIMFIHSKVRLKQVRALMSLLDKDADLFETWEEALSSEGNGCILEADINVGFIDRDTNLVVLTEKEIFGQPIMAKEGKGEEEDDKEKEEEKSKNLIAEDLKHLQEGDLVVHLNEGIGRYAGLKVLSVNGSNKEFFTIHYADSAKVFVDLNDLHLVSRYSGADPEKIVLDKKDRKTWNKKVADAISHIQGTALQLLQAQIARQQKKGLVCEKPSRFYHRFCQEFPYQPTQDQLEVSSQIALDLQSPVPMDRLVAGDVGFGKTEVAMRAAFVAADSGYQSVMLAPSTILAHQHFESFKSRFQNTRFNIVELSSSGKDKDALKKIASGEADIIIGTHKAIQKSVKYSNLGLLIVDEEHRFGVKAKEQLRLASSEINVLSMTATPIPRSLSMAMNGIRDMSRLAIPPAKRLSIRTQVRDNAPEVLREAIEREMLREGQVFYVHNNTTTIYEAAEKIRSEFPHIRVAIAHGKMTTSELELVMGGFHRHEYDVLVATTIIETGIDVPNANTIIIEDAENFGIASLHQLRGRVGRSHHQGYAYLLRGKAANSETSIKRLNAMESATQLGDGFQLANHDLAIRGAGEILGDEQSGHISKIGYELYDKIMRHALQMIEDNGVSPLTSKQVEALQKGADPLVIDIGLNSIISESYIQNEQLRLSLYRRISMISSEAEVKSLKNELEDRFGPLPNDTSRSLELTKMKTRIHNLGIREIRLTDLGGTAKVYHSPENSNKLLDFASSRPDEMQISSPFAAMITKQMPDPEQRLQYIKGMISDYSHF